MNISSAATGACASDPEPEPEPESGSGSVKLLLYECEDFNRGRARIAEVPQGRILLYPPFLKEF